MRLTQCNPEANSDRTFPHAIGTQGGRLHPQSCITTKSYLRAIKSSGSSPGQGLCARRACLHAQRRPQYHKFVQRGCVPHQRARHVTLSVQTAAPFTENTSNASRYRLATCSAPMRSSPPELFRSASPARACSSSTPGGAPARRAAPARPEHARTCAVYSVSFLDAAPGPRAASPPGRTRRGP